MDPMEAARAILPAWVIVVAAVSVTGSPGVSLTGAALGGLDHQMLETLAEQADARGDLHDADVFFAAADAVLPTQPEAAPLDSE